MKITKKFLEKHGACQSGMDYIQANNYIGLESLDFLNKLIFENKIDWANWFISHIMKYKQYVSYAIFAAEQVIKIYEKKYPNDDMPRKSIEAAKLCLNNPTKKNKIAANTASNGAAYAANVATITASYAANAACYAAKAADETDANNAVYAANAAFYSVANRKKIKLRIFNYGLFLIKTKKHI